MRWEVCPTCSGHGSVVVPCKKRRYHTRLEALVALFQSQYVDRWDKLPARTYHCSECRAWHITSHGRPAQRSRNVLEAVLTWPGKF